MARQREYRILLTKGERKLIKSLRKRASSANRRTRYSIILEADEKRHGKVRTYKEIASAAGASTGTVIAALKAYCCEGLDKAVTPNRNPRSDTARLKVTGDKEAKIIATACTAAPDGRARWTISLLTEEMAVVLEERIGRATIGRVLKKNQLHPHLNEYWCIPSKEDADFVACMEDILDVYQMPYDSKRPLWCMDEKPFQLLGEAREPLPMRKGDIAKYDCDYKRNGTVSIFCFIQPHTGRIVHAVEPTRTAVDWAEKIRFLVDTVEPEAEKIILVMDNLNTHGIASLYKAFPPAEARRIARKIEIHFTPKHGSWLDIAEIGINIMTRECLNRRIPGIEALSSELKAWNDAYDKDPSPVRWQFTSDDSRIKLKSLYPDIDKFRMERDERQKQKTQ